MQGNLISWYVYRMTYGVALCFVKLSILWFYRTIASHRTFRRVVNGTIVFVIAYTIGSTLASAFQCEKPSASYDVSGYLAQFDNNPKTPRPHVKCFDPSPLWLSTSAVNLFTDVLIMVMPIPTLLGLRVPMSKRLALIGIFSVGIMAIVASCVRMWVMALWSESPQNSARFGTDLLLWGQIETNSGIVSASVPFLRLMFRNSRERDPEEKMFARRKVREIKSPVEAPSDGQPLQKEGREEFEGDGQRDVEQGRGSPEWGGFITVPESLSSRSRGSEMLEPGEPVKPTMTV